MSKFYVGQRVRIVGAKTLVHLNGQVATIVAPGRVGDGERWQLDVDCKRPSPRKYGFGLWRDWHADQLAPAYDGNEKVSWESCLWQPNPERVS